MAKQNSINNKSQNITLDPGASRDSFLQFDINGTGEFRIGVDDADADSFKISQGSSLGTNDTFKMTAAGERTMPLHPAFQAYLSSNQSNVTGDNTGYTVICDTEVFDQGGDYNNGTGIFTAPIDGRYFFVGQISLDDLTTSHTRAVHRLHSTTSWIYLLDANFGAMMNPTTNLKLSGSIFMDLDAADEVYLQSTALNGAKVVDVLSGDTRFSGYLIC